MTLVLAVLLVGGGTLLAEYSSKSFVQSLATDAVRAGLNTSGQVDVDVPHRPFLPQLIRGTLTEIDLQAEQAQLRGLDIQDVEATAAGVRIRGEQGADTVDVTATVPVATLEELLRDQTGMDLTVGVQDGLLVISGDVAGLPVIAGVEVGVTDGELTATIAQATIAGLTVDASALPVDLSGQLANLGGVTGRLAREATVDSAEVVPDGLRVRLRLVDVLLADL